MSAPAKPKLLFLAHLLPWPLEGGGQIKSYHALRLLASHFDITLLAFIRRADETQNSPPLQPLCTGGLQTVLLPHSRGCDLIAAARAMGGGGSLLIARDSSPAMRAAVRAVLASNRFAAIHVDHLQMMAFVPPSGDPFLTGTQIVLDQHNIEHDLLRQLAAQGQGTSPLLRRMARWDLPRLRRFEQAACRRADRVLVVSPVDAAAIAEMIGKEAAAGKVRVTPIGVDTDYFAPAEIDPGTILPPKPQRQILSVGTMYWPPNVDAAQWFCAEILPLIRQDLPNAVFRIVGAKPTQSVQALAAAQPNVVTVTGRVPDIRPYMGACDVFVVPLRVGSGMRVKILSAMAMGLPIVSTTLGAKGIAVAPGENILLADTAADFAAAAGRILTEPALAERLGRAARDLAVRQYSWRVVGQKLLRAYEEIGVLDVVSQPSEEAAST